MFAPMRSTSSLLSTANGSAGAMSLLPNDWGRLLFLLDIIVVVVVFWFCVGHSC